MASVEVVAIDCHDLLIVGAENYSFVVLTHIFDRHVIGLAICGPIIAIVVRQ